MNLFCLERTIVAYDDVVSVAIAHNYDADDDGDEDEIL